MAGKSPAPRGRPKGSRNKRNQAVIDAAEAAGVTPLAFLLAVMNDRRRKFPDRLDAAKSAAPYVHPRLSSVEARVTDDTPPPLRRVEWVVVRPGDPLPDDEAAPDDVGGSRLN